VKPGIIFLYLFRKLGEPRKQNPYTGIYMNKKGGSPMINVNVLLFDPQKTNVGVIGNIIKGYPGHQPGEKSQRKYQTGIPNICTAKNLCYI
jgi:hypothetical protein